jgi:DNA adenine methylase
VSATANFTSYTRDGFTLDDQERLATCAASLRRRGVSVLLSNADVPIIRKLYKDFQMREVRAKRNINSVGAKRGAVGELLIW